MSVMVKQARKISENGVMGDQDVDGGWTWEDNSNRSPEMRVDCSVIETQDGESGQRRDLKRKSVGTHQASQYKAVKSKSMQGEVMKRLNKSATETSSLDDGDQGNKSKERIDQQVSLHKAVTSSKASKVISTNVSANNNNVEEDMNKDQEIIREIPQHETSTASFGPQIDSVPCIIPIMDRQHRRKRSNEERFPDYVMDRPRNSQLDESQLIDKSLVPNLARKRVEAYSLFKERINSKRKLNQAVIDCEFVLKKGILKEKEVMTTKKLNTEAVSPPNPFECNFCTKSFTSAASLSVHLRNHYQGSSTTTVMDCPFPLCMHQGDQMKLVKHMRSKHNLEKLFNCPSCPDNFFTMEAMIAHENMHSLPAWSHCVSCNKFHKVKNGNCRCTQNKD
jgi:transcription elongation factor Elf1